LLGNEDPGPRCTMAIASSLVAHSPAMTGGPANAAINDATDSTVDVRMIMIFRLILTRRPRPDRHSFFETTD
jgi:hypothetical protein